MKSYNTFNLQVIQVALGICGLFICEFAYSRLLKVYQNSVFAVFWLLFPRLFAIFGYNLTQNYTESHASESHLAIQCSLIIRGFKIRGTFEEIIYRELRGPPVLRIVVGWSPTVIYMLTVWEEMVIFCIIRPASTKKTKLDYRL